MTTRTEEQLRVVQPSTEEAPYTGVAHVPPCETCRYWAYPCAATRLVSARFGECRHDAPRLLLRAATGQATRHWPITGALDGCGKHDPVPTPTDPTP